MRKSPEKTFGLVFSFVFLLISIWPVLSGNPIRLLGLFISAFLLVLSFVKPELLKPFNFLWMKLGEILGKIVPPIVMLIIFFLIVTPTGFLLRIFKKDILRLKLSNSNSYWLEREKNVSTMDKQF